MKKITRNKIKFIVGLIIEIVLCLACGFSLGAVVLSNFIGVNLVVAAIVSITTLVALALVFVLLFKKILFFVRSRRSK